LPERLSANGTSMVHYDTSTHSFIVRIWLEESAEEAVRATWRGYVTHVPSGKELYFEDLDDITAFIAPYLERMGVRLRKSWQVKQKGE